jgi:hypothetical protein
VNVSGAIIASVLFFGVVFTAQKTGLAPEVTNRKELGEYELTQLDLHRGRPVYALLTSANGSTLKLGQPEAERPKQDSFTELKAAIFEGHDSSVIFEIEKAVFLLRAQKPKVSLSSFDIEGIVHYDFVLPGNIPAKDYDRQKLPRYLFIGAAIMVLIAFLWLLKPISRLKIETLGNDP